MSGFLTPHFELSQDDNFVHVRIKIGGHLRAKSEGEFYVLEHEFKFYLKPYFLRLTFRQRLVEDGRETAEHDISTGVLSVRLPKETPGEHFEGLDMITELLRRPTPKSRNPLIEVVGSSSAVDVGDACGGEDAGMSSDDDDPLGIEVEQELPSAPPEIALPGGPGGPSASSTTRYGFNGAYAGVFVGLAGEGLLALDEPESTAAEERRSQRVAAEDAAFDAEYYMFDLIEDERALAALAYTPCPLQTALHQLPRKEFLLEPTGTRRALCGLVDLLFAYAYDVRTTQGEPTVESGWTVRRLSSQLSWLDGFDNVDEAARACVRRALAYPLVRHYQLAARVVADVAQLLRLGRPAVLRALLESRTAVQAGGEYGYLLNKIWLDDYCVWVQQMRPKHLETLAGQLEAADVSRDSLAWPLAAYEDLARESAAEDAAAATADDDGESSSDVSDDSDDDDSDDDEEEPSKRMVQPMAADVGGIVV